MRFRTVTVMSVVLWSASCVGGDPWTNEDVGATESALKKGLGGTNGDVDYCNNPAELCVSGEGDCDSDSQCEGALVCGRDIGPLFSMPAAYDVCVPTHCVNGVQDADETGTDCGGVDCGTCDGLCTDIVPPDGFRGHCTVDCPCPAGESDCNTDDECDTGLVCGVDNGPQFGLSGGMDVCVIPECENGVFDSGEVAVDCGGVCGTVCGACSTKPDNGDPDRCSGTCPCPATDGDCDGDAQCAGSLICQMDVGALFGFDPAVDVCVAATCTNGMQDGDELGIDCGPSCAPCGGSLQYVDTFGDTNQENTRALAFDGDGNLIVVGRFLGTTNLGGSDLTRAGTSDTATDIFVAKYGPTGAHLWSQRYGAALADGGNGLDVAVGSRGEIAVAGDFNETVDFGGGDLTSAGRADAFVMMLESDGSHRWSKRYGSTEPDAARAVTVDRDGNVVVVGSFQETVDFGAGAVTSAGSLDAFVVKLRGIDGAHLRSTTFGGDGSDRLEGVAVGPDRRIYVAGAFQSTFRIAATTIVSAGSTDAFAARLSGATLAAQHVATFGGRNTDVASGIAVDGSSRVTLAGFFAESVDFGGGEVTSAGSTDAFVVGLTTDLVYSWESIFGGTAGDQAYAVASNAVGDRVAVSGFVEGTVSNFPGGSSSGAGDADAFLVVYDSTGATVFTERDGGSGLDFGAGVDISSAGLGYGGYFSGTATLLGTSFTSAGDRDLFISRITL